MISPPARSVALAVAPSNPEIIYVGSGEGLRRPDLSVGDGIYKSSDGGKSWKHLGLRDAQQIAAILVDPKDPNRLFVAAVGHPYGPNAERGIFRSLDGGENWEKVLSKNDDVGGADLAFDPRNAQTVYGVLWASRRPPWTTGNSYGAAGSGLYKSEDGGKTWRELTKGLPSGSDLGRIGIAIAPSDPKRMYAMVQSESAGGVYRSDDAGESWTHVNSEERVCGRGDDFAFIRVHPNEPDTIFVPNTSFYRSTDGGHSFTAIRGAPGGDDYHTVWINPENPQIIALASDQGVVDQREWRGNVEFLVQPAHGAVLPCHHRQSVSVLGLRRPAGKRKRRHRESQRLRRDHVSRLVSGGRGRVRVRGAGPAGSQHYLWRQGNEVQSHHGSDAGCLSGGAAHRQVSIQPHRPPDIFTC